MNINNYYEEEIQSLIDIIGNDIMNHINDLAVTDIFLNSDSNLWIEKNSEKIRIGKLSNNHGLNILKKIAHINDIVINESKPILTTQIELPINNNLTRKIRVQGFTKPVTTNASFTFRLHSNILYSLDNYIQNNKLTIEQKQIIDNAITNKKNIIISGEQRSGKTTIANAILARIADLTPDDRCIVLQDTLELQSKLIDTEYLMSTDNISLNDLVVSSLRMSSDRVIIGEIRTGVVALEALKICNIGNNGLLSTIHSDNAKDTINRFQELLLEVSHNDFTNIIKNNLDIIIYMQDKQVIEILELYVKVNI